MNGFGADKVKLLSAGGLIHSTFTQQQPSTLEQSVDYLVGMLVENNTYVSKEIINKLGELENRDTFSTACVYEKGPVCANINVFPKREGDFRVNVEDSLVRVIFKPTLNTIPDDFQQRLSKSLSGYEVALYNHKTGKISEPKTLRPAHQISINECAHDSTIYIDNLEDQYKVEDKKQSVGLSLIFFKIDPRSHLIDLLVPRWTWGP